MNIYFLVEGRRTEKKVYPKWLAHLIPELSEIRSPFRVEKNNFYVFNGNGFPSILDNHLRNSVTDVNDIAKFDYLVMCIDADEVDVQERTKEVMDFFVENSISLNPDTKFVLIVQNRCIETWCLGNKRVYKRNPSEDIAREYVKFYDVSENDPELMGKLESFQTKAQFHASYLKEMLYERNIRYSKNHPYGVTGKPYLDEMIKRYEETSHIDSFSSFLDFCVEVNRKIEANAR